MARERSPKRKEAFDIWKRKKGNIRIKDIAEKLGVSESQISKWKCEDNWSGKSKKKPTPKKEINNSKISKRRKTIKSNKSNINAIEKNILTIIEDNEELTEKQKLFCIYFLNNRNATQAYIKAYECDYNTAAVNACRLLKNAKLRKELEELRKLKNEAIWLNADDLIEKHMKIAFSDMTDFVEFGTERIPILDSEGRKKIDDNGEYICVKHNYLNVKDSNIIDGSLISEISLGKNGLKIKLEDREKSRKWLSDYFILNPMDKHKLEYDKEKLKIDKASLEHRIENDKNNSW